MYCSALPAGLQQGSSAPLQMAALQELLSDEEMQMVCRQLGHRWRDRALPPAKTVRSMLYRSLHHDKSIKAVMADMVAADNSVQYAATDAAWCQARSRLPEGLWPELIQRSVRRAIDCASDQHLCAGRPVYIADGSSLSMPDEPELVEAFGYANTKHGYSRFPVARLTLIVRCGVEVVCDYRLDDYRTSEDQQFHQLWQQIPSGAICLVDRHFSSFYNIAKLRLRRIDVVSRLHQRRSARRLIQTGKRIGKNDWIVELRLYPQAWRKYNDPSLPVSMKLRLVRAVFYHGGKRRTLWLITTLLDANCYPPEIIIRLYRKRWDIETSIGVLKTTLQLNVMRSKTYKAICSELAATVLAHNLVCTVIHQASGRTDTPSDRISFAGAIEMILTFSRTLRNVPAWQRPEIYDKMLRNIARRINPYRPGRIEPRKVKRDRRRYDFLKGPRHEARLACLS